MNASSKKLAVTLAAAVLLSLGVFRFWAFSAEEKEGPEKEASAAEEDGGKKTPAPDSKPPGAQPQSVMEDAEATPVAPPPFSPGIFPCSGCHEDLDPNPTVRTLKRKHTNIVLEHDEKNRWCYDCHTQGNMDKLHLASGKPVDFSESYKLCGQCHGPTLRDWKAGEHGKRTGSWSGAKQYLLCVNCHNPHSPKFQPLKPLPPPVRPKDLRP
ncbi:MAG: hypothetical protein L6R28_09195 [Planctomycetes bacterium]|nr:hypothetical protein [Planctomycetota bacterium]